MTSLRWTNWLVSYLVFFWGGGGSSKTLNAVGTEFHRSFKHNFYDNSLFVSLKCQWNTMQNGSQTTTENHVWWQWEVDFHAPRFSPFTDPISSLSELCQNKAQRKCVSVLQSSQIFRSPSFSPFLTLSDYWHSTKLSFWRWVGQGL